MARRRAGRPRIQIDRGIFENLCALQCTLEDIAGCFGCSHDTIERWCRREYRRNFAEIFEEKRGKGRISLRRTQWKLAERSPAMAIFLGKNYLGQTDRQDVKLSGKVGVMTIADLMLEDDDGADTDAGNPETDY